MLRASNVELLSRNAQLARELALCRGELPEPGSAEGQNARFTAETQLASQLELDVRRLEVEQGKAYAHDARGFEAWTARRLGARQPSKDLKKHGERRCDQNTLE